MEKSKSNFFIKILIFITFFSFLTLYLSKESGYYEYKNYKKMILTKESIKDFEEDIKENNDLTINDYINNEEIDYSNKLTKVGSFLGNKIEKSMHKVLKTTASILNKLFIE